jgi:hypothetical protein
MAGVGQPDTEIVFLVTVDGKLSSSKEPICSSDTQE